jgi:4,5-DOPA dioxygenase extradiol
MYEIEYPAKGSKELSNKVNDLFKSSDIETTLNSSRGLDHGSWTLLIHMFDSNEMPVVQISINPFLSVKEQINIGSVLKSLSENDYLIIGSGAVFHNFKYLTNSNEPLKEAVEFDQWLVDVVTNEDTDALENYQDNPLTKYAMERPEHFVPLLILYGARVGKPRVIHQSFEFGSLSNLSFEF